jgi:hypothetical protein
MLNLHRSNNRIVGSNPALGMDVYPHFPMLCCPVKVLALQWADPHARGPTKMSKCFMVSEVSSESEQARGPNP